MNATIDLQNPENLQELPSSDNFAAWVTMALPESKQNAEITIRIVGETASAKLNKQFRNLDRPTNILSFPYEGPQEILTVPLLGDLIICAPLLAKEAIQQHKNLTAHWCHLIVHGTLHLLGYDHQLEAQALVMESKEINILAEIGFPNPYLINGESHVC